MDMQLLNKAVVSLSYKRNEILIFWSTIQMLGNPKYIQILVDVNEKKMGIKALEYEKFESIIVPDKQSYQWSFKIRSRHFVHNIWKLTNWERDYSYRMYGEIVKDNELVEFRFDEGVQMFEGCKVLEEYSKNEKIEEDTGE